MEKATGPEPNESTRPALPALNGGVTLREERLRVLAPQWEAFSRVLRHLDDLPLGDTEPATVFVWRSEEG